MVDLNYSRFDFDELWEVKRFLKWFDATLKAKGFCTYEEVFEFLNIPLCRADGYTVYCTGWRYGDMKKLFKLELNRRTGVFILELPEAERLIEVGI